MKDLTSTFNQDKSEEQEIKSNFKSKKFREKQKQEITAFNNIFGKYRDSEEKKKVLSKYVVTELFEAIKYVYLENDNLILLVNNKAVITPLRFALEKYLAIIEAELKINILQLEIKIV